MSSLMSKDDDYYRAFHTSTSTLGPMWAPTSSERQALDFDMQEYVDRSQAPFMATTRTSTTAAKYARGNYLTRPMNEGFYAVFTSGARAYINTNPGASYTNNNSNSNSNTYPDNADHSHTHRPMRPLLARESTFIPSHHQSSSLRKEYRNAAIRERRRLRKSIFQDFRTPLSPIPTALIPSGIIDDDDHVKNIAIASTSTTTRRDHGGRRIISRRNESASGVPSIDQHTRCSCLVCARTISISPHFSGGDSAYTTHTHTPSPNPSSSGRYSSSHSNANSVDAGYDVDDRSSIANSDENNRNNSAGFDVDFSLYQHAEEMHHLQHMNRHSRSSRTPTPPSCDTAPRERSQRQPFVHGDEHMRPAIQQARYALSMMRPLADKKMFCKFCKNKGEEPRVYSTHLLNDSDGRVVCPILQSYICPLCGATGYDAHTIKYCPHNEFDISEAMDRMLTVMSDA